MKELRSTGSENFLAPSASNSKTQQFRFYGRVWLILSHIKPLRMVQMIMLTKI